MPNINCTVDNCTYWNNGNTCTAKQIVVQNDRSGGFPPDSNLAQLSPTPAQKNDETCCQTFKHKM
ncbi:MAG: DUF1540 domain-containing protein [Heliobacteriaceae bacterium]|nr:DUF1540 domain-containing protein [Heliobacteriaceae bacterium]MDD4587775.1 DUF1540 domain-containing protein [Heliobacteriaceae bacterium]